MARTIQTVTELRERAARRASGDMSETEFRSQFSALLSRVPPHTIQESTFFSLPAGAQNYCQTRRFAARFRSGDEVVIVN